MKFVSNDRYIIPQTPNMSRGRRKVKMRYQSKNRKPRKPTRVKIDRKVLWFGKFKGYTIYEVYLNDAQYLRWILENTRMLVFSERDRKKIMDKARKEDNDQLARRARRFFGGADMVGGLNDVFMNTAFSRYDSEEMGFMDEEPH